MRTLAVAVALCCLTVAEKPKEETGPVEVDLSPLVGLKDVTLTLSVRFEEGTVLEEKRERTGPVIDRDDVVGWVADMAKDIREDYHLEFDAVAVKGEPKLVIRGYKCKGVLEVKCVAVGLPRENQPKVSRLKEKEKK